MSPLLVTSAQTESLPETATLELVPRNCTLKPYTKTSVPEFSIAGDFIAYASPDSTYAVTRRLMDAASGEIIIGIYDFSADYMKDLVLHTMKRGVKVYLMLDIDSDGITASATRASIASPQRLFCSFHDRRSIGLDQLGPIVGL